MSAAWWRVGATVLMGCALATPFAGADDEASSPRSESWGTATDTAHVIGAYAFLPEAGAGTNLVTNGGFGARGCDSSPCELVAPVMLPAGAIINTLELEACDIDSSAQMTATLVRVGPLQSGFTNVAAVSTGVAAMPGCAYFRALTNDVVDNFERNYRVRLSVNPIASGLFARFHAVRLFYRLQVSPAPTTASFPNDVPTTHPFFRFIEALASAGITGGCGAGSYCPNNPVTRGEMAVFLATALGLHFPN